jgi:DNA-binding response OmpR family regulator
MASLSKDLEKLVQSQRILVIDDEAYSRKVIRALLQTIGIKQIHEAIDGFSGLDAILTVMPDIVLVDWEMPGLDGPGFLRRVRAPGIFPMPDVPIIMLTGHGERSCVIEAMRLGIHEYLLKPVSSQALLARIVSILTQPRPMVRRGAYYGPLPRKASAFKPEDAFRDTILLN